MGQIDIPKILIFSLSATELVVPSLMTSAY
jgi:hypothetical protein